MRLRYALKPCLWVLLLFLGCVLTAAAAAPGEQPPSQADIARLVAAAGTYQPGQSLEPFRGLEELVRQSLARPDLRKPLEAGLIKLLGPRSTFEARRFACKQLGIIGGQTALPALANLLKNEQTAGIGCLALTTYPPGKADQVLRAALGSAPGAARVEIITTLGDRRDAKAVKPLTRLARGPDPALAEAAIASLGKIGNDAARQAIASLRTTAASALGPALTEATLRCAERLASSGETKAATAAYEDLLRASQPAYVRRSAFAALLPLQPDQGEQRILAVLHGSDPTLKPVAIAAVRSLQSSGASEKFARELAGLRPEEQVWMIDSLAARGDPVARGAIETSLASPDTAVRRAAISALGRIGGPSAVPLFARLLATSTDADERRAVESALVGLGGGAETDTVVRAELEKSSGTARAQLIAVFARRQGPAADALLFAQTSQADPAVAKAAFRALGKTATENDVPALLERLADLLEADLRTDAEGAAARALSRIADASRRAALVCAALDRAPPVEGRNSLLGLLPACGGPKALAALKTAVGDSDARVRAAAVRALADWPDASAWDDLAGVYRQPENESLRAVALRGLVRLATEENAHPDAALIDRYRQLLAAAQGDGELKLVLGALGGAAHPDALQLALPLLANAGVRAEAEAAVKKIAEAIKAQHPQAAAEALQQLTAKP